MVSTVQENGLVNPTYMVVYRFEDLLGRNQQGCHLPNGHLKVHLRELEESVPPIAYQPIVPFHLSRLIWSLPLKEARHAYTRPVGCRG